MVVVKSSLINMGGIMWRGRQIRGRDMGDDEEIMPFFMAFYSTQKEGNRRETSYHLSTENL